MDRKTNQSELAYYGSHIINFLIQSYFILASCYFAVLCKKSQYDIVIGILSARANSEQRQALRDTWVGHVTKRHQLKARYLYHTMVTTLVPEGDVIILKFLFFKF